MYLSISSVFFLVCTVGLASAAPLSGTLIGDVSKDILNYECTSLNDSSTRISCDFVQVLLSKKSKASDLSKTLEQWKSERDGDPATFQKQICTLSMGLQAIIQGDTDASLDGMSRADIIEAIDDYRSSPIRAKEDLKRIASDVRTACLDPSLEALTAVVSTMHDQETRSCEVFVNKYTQTYVRVSDTLWAVESTPSGVCGVVNTSKFVEGEQSGILWEYEASKIIQNKKGTGLIACADLDETKTLYSWKSNSNFLGCDYIN